jgi:hypothetical protein
MAAAVAYWFARGAIAAPALAKQAGVDPQESGDIQLLRLARARMAAGSDSLAFGTRNPSFSNCPSFDRSHGNETRSSFAA